MKRASNSHYRAAEGPFVSRRVEVGRSCDRCGGEGELAAGQCERCEGTGELSRLITIEDFRTLAGIDPPPGRFGAD